MFGFNHFGIFDYIAVAITLSFSIFIGLYHGFKGKQTKEEVFVGGRNMSPFPIAASMIVTYFSAITIIGYPAEIYSYGIQIYIMTILLIVFIPLSTLIYVRVLFEMKLTSVYEYLELRFDTVLVRWLASFTFILQFLFINAVVLYSPAIVLEVIVGLPVWVSVMGIGVIGTVYTSLGGLRAVVWTDVLQFFIILIGMCSIMTKGFVKAGGFIKAFSIAAEKGRLNLFDFSLGSFSFDPFMRHNTWNILLGYGFAVMSSTGTHPPQVQRYSSLPTFATAVKALLFAIPLKIFTMTITVLTGISVAAAYIGCCPILLGKINKVDAIIPYFVIEELAFFPGMMGIFASCVLSAVLSSLSSALNSLSAVTWEDFLSKISIFKTMKPTSQAQVTKLISLIYGVLIILLALGAQNLGTIFQIVVTAAGVSHGPLGGIFLCGLFIPFMNKYGAIAGIICGLSSMMFVAVNSFILGRQYTLNPRLPTDLSACPEGTDFTNVSNATSPAIPDLVFPQKLYTLSYILYPFVGAVITILAGVLVSIVTGGFKAKRKFDEKYIHPWIRNVVCVQRYLIRPEIDANQSIPMIMRSSPAE